MSTNVRDEAMRYIAVEATNMSGEYAGAARIMTGLLEIIEALEKDVEVLTLLSVKGADILIKEGKVPLST